MNMRELGEWLTDRFRQYERGGGNIQSLITNHPSFMMFIVRHNSPASSDRVLYDVLQPYLLLEIGNQFIDFDRYRIPESSMDIINHELIINGYITPDESEEQQQIVNTSDGYEIGSIFKIEDRDELYMLCRVGTDMYGLVSLNTGNIITRRHNMQPILNVDILQMTGISDFEYLSGSLQSYIESKRKK